MKRIVVLGIIIGIAAVTGWLWWADGIRAVDTNDPRPVAFAVATGEGVKSIVSRLSQQGLIRSPTAFYLLVKVTNIERDIQAGDFRLNKAMDAETLSKELTHGVQDVWVTIPEGWRVEEVASRVAKELDIPEQEFLKSAAEGYMFPDTYLVPREATAGAIARILLDNFEKKVGEELRRDAEKQGLTMEEIITLASIVEREGKSDEDRPIIASVLLNRLRSGMPLQADATLQYALGYQAQERIWWKKVLTDEDKNVVSPFNTYQHPGLPPYPIANPGLGAIRAVIYPAQTSYLYYLHDPVGVAHFALTLEEHNGNVQKYLR